jgi:signal transduction histidine kinase
VIAESERHYSNDDLDFASHFAARAAMALDNSRLYEKAQRAVHTRDNVLAVVSHDLRSPLNAILLQASSLLRAPLEDRRVKGRKSSETIRSAAKRMDRMIGDLLDAASIDANRLSLDIAPQPIGPIVRDSIEALDGTAGVTLRLDWKTAEDITVACDRGRIVQVLGNLLGNAIKFTPTGGGITVRLETRGHEILLAVEDSGPGIPRKQFPHLFERFWQDQKTAHKGTGLGLAISKGIVEAHGGRIWVESEVGQGTTFFFTLPCVPSPKREAHPATASPDGSDFLVNAVTP